MSYEASVVKVFVLGLGLGLCGAACGETADLSNVGTVDAELVSIGITSPVNGSTVAAGSLKVTGSATGDGKNDSLTVAVGVDSEPFIQATPGPSGYSTWSIVVSLGVGSHEIYARLTDSHGHETTTSITVSAALATGDAGPTDAGSLDAGWLDGAKVSDSGASDATSTVDAGPQEGGTLGSLLLDVYWVQMPAGPAPSAELWSVVQNHYTSLDDPDEEPGFWTRFPNQHDKFRQPSSYAGVQADASNPAPANVIVYDPEHWTATPQVEQNNQPYFIGLCADAAHAAGLEAGVAPDREFLETLYTQIDWTKEDWLIMQLQRIANQPSQVMTDVQNIAGHARSVNPNIKIMVHLSLAFAGSLATLQQDIDGIKTMSPRVVSGIGVVYHTDPTVCPTTLCNPSNLDAALSEIAP